MKVNKPTITIIQYLTFLKDTVIIVFKRIIAFVVISRRRLNASRAITYLPIRRVNCAIFFSCGNNRKVHSFEEKF